MASLRETNFFDALQAPDSVEGRYPISAAGEGAAARQDSNHESIWSDLTTNSHLKCAECSPILAFVTLHFKQTQNRGGHAKCNSVNTCTPLTTTLS